MTFSPEKELANHVRYVAVFDDGSRDAFAVSQCTLDQGPRGGWDNIARIVAYEWQCDGLLKPGNIVRVYLQPTTLPS